MKKIVFMVIGVVIIFAIFMMYNYFSYNNREVVLHNKIIAQQENIKVIYDKVWKIISQEAQVTEQYKESFKEIYIPLMEGRYSGSKDGSLMKWVQEANPTFDIKLYDKLMVSIEGLRTEFAYEQTKLIDIKREHDNLIDVQPSRFFLVTLGGKQKVELNLVTSQQTENVFNTGKEDNINLFNNKK